MSHHPPISSFYVTNRQDGFTISGTILAKSKFYGNSTSAILDGVATLSLLTRGEDYNMTMPYAHCKVEHSWAELMMTLDCSGNTDGHNDHGARRKGGDQLRENRLLHRDGVQAAALPRGRGAHQCGVGENQNWQGDHRHSRHQWNYGFQKINDSLTSHYTEYTTAASSAVICVSEILFSLSLLRRALGWHRDYQGQEDWSPGTAVAGELSCIRERTFSCLFSI